MATETEKKPWDLTGKTALVLCATGGIGLGTAEILAKYGVAVDIVGRDPDKLSTAKEIIGDNCHETYCGDITDPDQFKTLVSAIKGVGKTYDILIVNPPGPPPDTKEEVTGESIARAKRYLVDPLVTLVLAFKASMIKNGYGRIIYVGSITLKKEIPNLISSGVGRKVGQKLMDDWRMESNSPITYNTLEMGLVRTERSENNTRDMAKRKGISFKAAEKIRAREIPCGELMETDGVGECIAFLCTKSGSYINGNVPIGNGQ